MGSTDADRLISELEAGFAAAVAAEEDIAADDLAFSLSQDVPVSEDLLRSGGFLMVDDVAVPIDRVGHDFVVAGAWIAPLGRALIRLGGDGPSQQVHDVFVSVLRRTARVGTEVSVGVGAMSHHGRLSRATSAHLVISGPAVSMAVPLEQVDYVRFVRGDSADAL